jgi:hypothetical protein
MDLSFVESPVVQVLGSVASILMGLPLLSLALYHVFALVNRPRVLANRIAGCAAALAVFVAVPLVTRPAASGLFPLMAYEALKLTVWLAMVSLVVLARGPRHFWVSLAWSSALAAGLAAASWPALSLAGLARLHASATVLLAAAVFMVVPFLIGPDRRGTENTARKGSRGV